MKNAWTLPLVVLVFLCALVIAGTVIALIWEANADAWNPVVGYLFFAFAELAR